MYESYPDDPEAALFYSVASLSLVGTERGFLQRGATILPKVDKILQDVLV